MTEEKRVPFPPFNEETEKTKVRVDGI